MRLAIWSVILAAVAVGIALFARNSPGYVVIVDAPWRIELSLNLLVFLVVAGYFAFYMLARLVTTLVAIPRRVRAYREERTRSRNRQSLNDALLAFFDSVRGPGGEPCTFLLDEVLELRTFESFPGLRHVIRDFITRDQPRPQH